MCDGTTFRKQLSDFTFKFLTIVVYDCIIISIKSCRDVQLSPRKIDPNVSGKKYRRSCVSIRGWNFVHQYEVEIFLESLWWDSISDSRQREGGSQPAGGDLETCNCTGNSGNCTVQYPISHLCISHLGSDKGGGAARSH